LEFVGPGVDITVVSETDMEGELVGEERPITVTVDAAARE
jgi:hypothetical protein